MNKNQKKIKYDRIAKVSNIKSSNYINSSINNSNNKMINNVSNNPDKEFTNNNKNIRNRNKKIIIRRKLNINAVIILISIIIILSLIPLLIFLLKNDKNDKLFENNYSNEKVPINNNNNNNSNNNNNNNNNSDNNSDNNIKEKLSFFKEENVDRYNSYKEKNPDLDFETVVVHVNIGLDREFYTNIMDSPLQHTNLVLSNKYYNLSKNYVPKNLKSIDSKYSSGDKKMEKEAADAFNSLTKDAKLEGYTIRAVSTYRSYDYQKNLYSNYVKSDGVKMADTYSARAGHSEHQTGLAVDVDNNKKSYTSFGSTDEFKWMIENAYKYGFILRYTKDNEFITGYKDEPWHYRYVGVEIATYIQNNPMTYEEYYVRFLDK